MSDRTLNDAVGRTTRSGRGVRLQARAPRIVFLGLIVILSITGLRTIFEPGAEPAAAVRVEQRGDDVAAQTFAEGFVRAYLTWDAADPAERERQLARFLPSTLAADGGLEPGDDRDQEVLWTAVADARTDGSRTVVTVVAQTSADRGSGRGREADRGRRARAHQLPGARADEPAGGPDARRGRVTARR